MTEAAAKQFSKVQEAANQYGAIVICKAKDSKRYTCPQHEEDDNDIWADFMADDACHKCIHYRIANFHWLKH